MSGLRRGLQTRGAHLLACRHEFPPPPPSRDNWRWGLGIAAVICGVITVSFLLPAAAPKSAAEQATEAKAAAINAAADQAEQAREHAGSSASNLCLNSVRVAAQYPSKVDFYMLDHSRRQGDYKGSQRWLVSGKVDLMNGFGAMIPHKYMCVVGLVGGTMIDFAVRPE